jgi:hypothetical protein
MASGDHYRILAAKCDARACAEGDRAIRHEWEIMSHSYLRLAEQAERNARLVVVYEPLPVRLHDPEPPPQAQPRQTQPPQTQQPQAQQQPQGKLEEGE